MKNEEILRKAIEKAVKNGWNFNYDRNELLKNCKKSLESPFYEYGSPRYFSIIFSHSFAKAFWGEDEYESNFSDILKPDFDGKLEEKIKRGWHYHLQQLVLQENPLEYIKKFL